MDFSPDSLHPQPGRGFPQVSLPDLVSMGSPCVKTLIFSPAAPADVPSPVTELCAVLAVLGSQREPPKLKIPSTPSLQGRSQFKRRVSPDEGTPVREKRRRISADTYIPMVHEVRPSQTSDSNVPVGMASHFTASLVTDEPAEGPGSPVILCRSHGLFHSPSTTSLQGRSQFKRRVQPDEGTPVREKRRRISADAYIPMVHEVRPSQTSDSNVPVGMASPFTASLVTDEPAEGPGSPVILCRSHGLFHSPSTPSLQRRSELKRRVSPDESLPVRERRTRISADAYIPMVHEVRPSQTSDSNVPVGMASHFTAPLVTKKTAEGPGSPVIRSRRRGLFRI
ncbi:uncharacterized protein LOC114772177 [Denticeps clupeoides]|uniref:uncharacterized protein LOC114766214 n=1 Tax=Denticeps clupeoides TaxID=299321 RepID=UPI0010A5557F|nr:uncharacterized protein LOC114766214 [Denticeps clupeoides]XP_028821050.1 uncharacterized protein LOC114772177 [Denticeps clupeoides]